MDVQEQGVLLRVRVQPGHRFCQDGVGVEEVRVGEEQGCTWKAEDTGTSEEGHGGLSRGPEQGPGCSREAEPQSAELARDDD